MTSLFFLLAGCAKPSIQSLQSLSVTATPSTVSVGGAVILRATAHLSDGTTQDVSTGTVWTVSDTSLATVTGSVLTSQSPGQVSVQGAFVQVAATGTASSAAAASQTLNSSTQVTITPVGTTTTTPTITWSAPAAIAYGTALSSTQLDAQASVAGTFSYNPAAGTVLQAGVQTLTTTFTPNDTQHNSAATASVQVTVIPATPTTLTTPTISWNAPAPILYGTALSSAQLNATASVTGTFLYTPAAGTVLQAGTQTLGVTFTPVDTTDYSTANATVQIVVSSPPTTPVNPAAPVITWNTPAAINQGIALTSVQLDATASVPGTFVYAPAAGTVLPAGNQTLTTTFTPGDTAHYSTATATVQIAVLAAGPPPVNPIAPIITWAAPAAITYGTPLSSAQLDATANVPGTFVYSPAAGTALQAGSQTLTTTFTPADTTHYSTATAAVNVAVTQGTPVITWATPAAISLGTALSSAQLNATASVAGTFTYLPSSGTVPAAGTVQLTATFTPSDAGYTAVTTLRTLIVTGTPNPVPTGCGGPTINLNPGMSQSTLQSTIQSAPNCALLLFAAGTYNLTANIVVPCTKNLTLTGPATTPATAVLSGTGSMSEIFYITGCSGITFEYLGFANTTGIYGNVPSGGSSGVTITHSQFFGLSGTSTDFLAEAGIYFTGFATGGTLSNVSVTWNNFGSPTDCNGVMTELVDQGGYCSGLVFTASLNNITVSNNTFHHLEEGFHVNCTQGGCLPPASSNTWQNFTAENNDFSEIHRIGMEMQIMPSSNIVIQHNDAHDFVNGYDSTMGISSACCDTNASSPGTIDSDNVLIANQPVVPQTIPGSVFAIEFWGNGAIAQGNLVQGQWAYGIAFGYAPNAVITGNTICGPILASKNSYIWNEEHQAIPTIAPNTTSPACSAVTSTAPTISPASGTVSGLTTVTLSDSGVNHSVYYTLDGSTPTTSSPLYTAPFAVAAGTTVNAIGMWGQGANAKSYPAGYGYVPSAVVSATYLDGSLAKPAAAKVAALPSEPAPSGSIGATLQSISIAPSQAAVAIGSSLQLKAVANYSDGTTRDITGQFGWSSSDIRTIAVGASGLLSGLATGNATISGTWQGHTGTVPASSSIGALQWSGPLTITRGGIYSGNWESNDPQTAAVTIATAEPVIIENSHLRGVTSLIRADVAGANLTVRNNVAIALPSTVKGAPHGAFLNVTSPARLDVENNYIENVSSGVAVYGYSGKRDGTSTILIRANRGRNLNGASFIELDQLQAVPGIDIGWNEVINYPGTSWGGDNIRVYQSGGTANQPLDIHDGYIEGAYSLAALHGSGITVEGGANPELTSAFNSVHDNQIVSTGSHGIAFAAGHDNLAFNNRVLSSGLFADGTRIYAPSVGMANESSYNNTMHDNLIGWMCWTCKAQGYRNDAYLPASPRDYSTNLHRAAQSITFVAEHAEYQRWVNKVIAAGELIGPSF